jgi:hypothetical protein
MQDFDKLFKTPELYPLKIDFDKRSMVFVRMTRAAYESCLFVSFRRAERFGGELCDIRLDDVLLASQNSLSSKRTIYILHTAYCCSTLLARYFELFPSSFVLKEPPLLAQVANTSHLPRPKWSEVLDLSIRLLTRTFRAEDTAVIKTHVPCNMIGRELLEQNPLASIIYLFTPIRSFLLAVLKSEKRRQRIRTWNREVSLAASRCPDLAGLEPERLTDAQAAAYWWLATRFFCQELCVADRFSRVWILNGEDLALSPEMAIPSLMDCYGLPQDEQQCRRIVTHPSIHAHSKYPEREFDGSALQKEQVILEDHYGAEADTALSWMLSHGLHSELPRAESPLSVRS